MADKEEKILLIFGDKSDIDEFPYLFPWDKLEKTKRVVYNRAEAVERMAKAMYVDNWKRRTPLVRVTNWEKGFADNMKKKYILAAEAALDALLGENK